MPRQPGSEPECVIGIDEDGVAWKRLQSDNSEWFDLGIAPYPRTVWETFWYHVGHGLVMRYPFWSILSFAWTYRRSFVDNPPGSIPDHELAVLEYSED